VETHSLESERLFIDGSGGVAAVPITPDFYAKIRNRADLGGTLISYGAGNGTPSMRWEMHPAGEEILIIMEGTPVIIFEHPDGREESKLCRSGEAVIVPRGVWHRIERTEGSKILYITYGTGTTGKPVVNGDRAE